MKKNSKEKYWVTGGIVGILFSIMYLFIIGYLPKFTRFMCIHGNEGFFNCFVIKYFDVFGSPAVFIINHSGFFENVSTASKGIFAIIILFMFYFLLGALIGQIYKKIKCRKKKVKKDSEEKFITNKISYSINKTFGK